MDNDVKAFILCSPHNPVGRVWRKEELKEMLENHVKYTGSDVAENMLNNWSEEVKNFVKVIPNDYKKVITVLDEELEKGTDRDEAMLIAFENVTGKKVEIA